MNKKKEDDYYILFQGGKLSKREANKVGIGIIFGLIGIFATHFLQIGQNSRIVNYIIITAFSVIGYLVIGNRIFKRKDEEKEK